MLGIALGSLVGTWLGGYVTGLFGEYYQFPSLVFSENVDVYVLAAALSLAAAVAGAFRAIRGIVALPPAVAMLPPAPLTYRHILPGWLSLSRILSPPLNMTLRGLSRRPLRAVMTAMGISFATAVLTVSLFIGDSVVETINVTYFLADRQDASIGFVRKQSADVTMEVARLPGVLSVEAIREVPARIRRGSVERRVSISGRQRDADLSRIIDTDLRPIDLPESGLAISAYLARILGVTEGDTVELDLLEGQRRTVMLPVAALVEDYFGIRAMMNAPALARLMREAPSANGANVNLDKSRIAELFASIKSMPPATGLALQDVILGNYRQSLAVTITTMAGVYTGLATIIAFGIVYNSARITLSERTRELASLRVLGFTRWEAMRILLLELAILTLLAQPPGWVLGYGLSWIMATQLAGELMRIPMIMQNLTYGIASAVVLAAATASALVVARRVRGLDLVAVLKTRE